MATRSTKTVASTTPATPVKRTARGTEHKAAGLDQQHAADIDDESSVRAYFDNLKAQFKMTWTRERVVGLVLGLAVSFATGYLIGTVLGYIILAVSAYSTSLFLACMIYALGVLLAMWLGGKLGSAVYEYVGSGAARTHITGAARWVKGLFSGRDESAA